jgi:hypothetical protein
MASQDTVLSVLAGSIRCQQLPVRRPNCGVGSLCRHSIFVGAPLATGTFEAGDRQAARPPLRQRIKRIPVGFF